MSLLQQESAQPPLPREAAAYGERTILVIDGDAGARELLGLHLANAGYKVLLAEDALVGAQMVVRHVPDLIIADLGIRCLGSVGLLTTLRSDGRLRDIPLVFLGSSDAPDNRTLAVAAQAYLAKPVPADRLLAVVARQISERSKRAASARLALASRKLHVLVADDNRDTVLMLAMLLRDEGHEVHAAYNGVEVLKSARLSAFDAIIIDIEMPQMSGYAVAQELRTQYYGTRAPLLIAISGKWNRASEKLLAQSVGFDHHLEKPCDPNALIRLLAPLTVAQAERRSA